MRTLYTLVVLALIIAVLLLGLTFVYFAKTAHKHFCFVIQKNELPWGVVEIDRYVTEGNIIYKAKEYLPYETDLFNKNMRITLDKRNLYLKDYEEERFDTRCKELYYLQKSPEGLGFLSIARSKFSTLKNLKEKKDALPFSRNTLVTWFPFIELYNFKRGGAQSFNTVKYDLKLLPPNRRIITLTSIRDEYIDIDNKKVKTECLLLKERGKEQIFVWVSKSEHTIQAYHIPSRKIYGKLTRGRIDFIASGYTRQDPSYVSKKVSFFAKEKEMTGILSRPKEKGVYPAIILVQGEESTDENNFGMFVDLSDYLSRHNYVTLRFAAANTDGAPKYQAVSIGDELAALESAVTFLEEYRFVDTNRIGIIAHADANFILPYLIKKDPRVRSWVMLSPCRLVPIVDTEMPVAKASIEKIVTGDTAYKETIFKSADETLEIVEESTKDKKNIFGKKIFMTRMKEILKLNPFEHIPEISVPIMVVQGKMDELHLSDYFKLLEETLKSKFAESRSIVFFRTLGHYLGDMIENERIRKHVEMNTEVLETITGWLDKNLTAPKAVTVPPPTQ